MFSCWGVSMQGTKRRVALLLAFKWAEGPWGQTEWFIGLCLSIQWHISREWIPPSYTTTMQRQTNMWKRVHVAPLFSLPQPQCLVKGIMLIFPRWVSQETVHCTTMYFFWKCLQKQDVCRTLKLGSPLFQRTFQEGAFRGDFHSLCTVWNDIWNNLLKSWAKKELLCSKCPAEQVWNSSAWPRAYLCTTARVWQKPSGCVAASRAENICISCALFSREQNINHLNV